MVVYYTIGTWFILSKNIYYSKDINPLVLILSRSLFTLAPFYEKFNNRSIVTIHDHFSIILSESIANAYYLSFVLIMIVFILLF